MSVWYKRSNGGSFFYTPLPIHKKDFKYVAHGSKSPTPKELADELNSLIANDHKIDHVYRPGCIQLVNEQKVYGESCELPNGIFNYVEDDYRNPDRLVPLESRTDDYIRLSDFTANIKTDIDTFITNEDFYISNRIIYKLGILTFGPPGNGKSSLLRDIFNDFADKAVIIFLEKIPPLEFLQKIQTSLKDRLKIFVFEELATMVNEMSLQSILNFLDGQHSINKSIFIATTNYPEKIPANLIDRPSRFDKRYKIGNPNAEDRKRLLNFYLKRDITEEEVKRTEGFSIAVLKELSLLILLQKMSFSDAATHLQDFSKLVLKDFAESKPLGF